jgi:hypothetical protein
MSYDQPVGEECVNHPGYAVAGDCPVCGQALCATCLAAHEQDPERYCPAAVPARPEKPRRSPTLALGIIAGVLFLCVAGLVIAAVVYFNNQAASPANSLNAPMEQPGLPPPEVTPPPPPPLAPPPPAPAAVPAPPLSGTAREEAAKAVALQGKPGWVAVINWHQPDWSEVRVWIGPTRNDPRLSLSLVWDPNLRTYTLMDEGPVVQPPPATAPPVPASPAPAPAGPQPGRQAALAAALANDPGDEAKVVSHSRDWKQVTVDTGQPLQPLSHEYRFHWDDDSHQYILDHMGALGWRGGANNGE